jgi:hypothetical protein
MLPLTTEQKVGDISTTMGLKPLPAEFKDHSFSHSLYNISYSHYREKSQHEV